MRRFAITPDRELGQNFLIDSNILGVIERAAELRPGETAPSAGTSPRMGGDVVLEIGGGLGVLSEHLATRTKHVHVVEIDERLREALLDATGGHANVSVHWGDVMTMDLAALSPAPTKVVANLPYGVAAGALLRTIEELADVDVWVAMVQKEVGERLAAAAGSAAYGAPSAIAQLACDVRVIRAIPRTVFHPVPNVDSVLVTMRRRGPAPSAELRALVGGGVRAPPQDARHLPGDVRAGEGSLARADEGGARGAWLARGHPRRATLAAGLQGTRKKARHIVIPEALPLRALAPAKINLGLFVGPGRSDGRHELVSVMQSISLADELTLERAVTGIERDEVVCEGVTGENLAGRALELFREATGWDEGPVRITIDKRVPVAAGLGGGSSDAAATLRLARTASGLGDEDLLFTLAGQIGADVPAQVSPGRWLATGAGELLEVLPDPVSPFGVLVLAQAARLSTAEVYVTADRLNLGRDARFLSERREALRAALELGAALPGQGELLHNDLQEAAVALCPAIEPALRQAEEVGAEVAFVSGSGPTVVGLFARANGLARAERAAAGLQGREPPPVTAGPVDASFGEAHAI